MKDVTEVTDGIFVRGTFIKLDVNDAKDLLNMEAEFTPEEIINVEWEVRVLPQLPREMTLQEVDDLKEWFETSSNYSIQLRS